MAQNIVINGKKYDGEKASIINGKLYVDGTFITNIYEAQDKNITVICNGCTIDKVVTTSGDITVNGNVDTASSTSGDINVSGDICHKAHTISGDIKANTLIGTADTMSGDVNEKYNPFKNYKTKFNSPSVTNKIINRFKEYLDECIDF